MCRFSCPTAVVSGNDAVTPCNKNSLRYKEERWPGRASQGGPLWPIYDCTGCGRCTEYCVYEMPVADQLFDARAKYSWEAATEVASRLNDQLDPAGDLADELGDVNSAQRRMATFSQRFDGESNGELTVDEPRTEFFLKKNGKSVKLSWQRLFDLDEAGFPEAFGKYLHGRRWLVHESVWLSRRLKRVQSVLDWIASAKAAGVELVMPFAHGMDCIDCGGEGAYPLLFEQQARQMACDIWERDRHRAEGVLCFSERCANHLRVALGPDVPVVALSELVKQLANADK